MNINFPVNKRWLLLISEVARQENTQLKNLCLQRQLQLRCQSNQLLLQLPQLMCLQKMLVSDAAKDFSALIMVSFLSLLNNYMILLLFIEQNRQAWVEQKTQM